MRLLNPIETQGGVTKAKETRLLVSRSNFWKFGAGGRLLFIIVQMQLIFM